MDDLVGAPGASAQRRNGRRPDHQIVENDAEAEDVGAAVDQVSLAAGLFRTHEGRSSNQVMRARAEIFVLEGQPEVSQKRDVRQNPSKIFAGLMSR